MWIFMHFNENRILIRWFADIKTALTMNMCDASGQQASRAHRFGRFYSVQLDTTAAAAADAVWGASERKEKPILIKM